MAPRLPLNALLGQAMAAFLAADEASPPLAVYANILRPIGDGTEVADLPTAARLSKRMVKAALKVAAKKRWVVVDDAVVRPAGPVPAPPDAWPQLKPALRALVEQFALEWPHCPAGYGTADVSAAGGAYVSGHGQDWKPVPRETGDTTSSLPTYALLSQALMQFTADFETRGLGALLYAATILRRIPDTGAPTADFPLLARLKGDGKSALERHLYLTIAGSPRVAHLTPRGADVRDRYDGTVASIEDEWRDRYGDDVVTDVRSGIEALDLDPAFPHHIVGELYFL